MLTIKQKGNNQGKTRNIFKIKQKKKRETHRDRVRVIYNYMVVSSKHSEKAMATYSSTLAWKIPWMEEPGGLQFMGSQRVRHD